MSAQPTGIDCVIPSRLAVGDSFSVKLKLLGPVREIPARAQFNTRKPALHGPFNLNAERRIQYVDDSLPAWAGRLRVEGEGGLDGPREIVFDGDNQGVFPGDTRPIRSVEGFRWREPGIHFLRLEDPESGLMAWSNPVCVTADAPALRLVWGDPHWQTFFSDGVRCPEELHAFARDEAFLDFGAISDHMEAVTDRQWEYFQAVSNDFNEPGRYVTLHGQEWTHHNPAFGAPGHRNLYFRGAGAPALRSTDPDCNTLAKLWGKLDAWGRPAIAIPHHSANARMGVDWELGWQAAYETAVEMYSIWGSSEKSVAAGNTRPIRHCGGEREGRHVLEALRRGYRLGFVGGGDVHDGRPGRALHRFSYPGNAQDHYEQGLTAAWVPALTREAVFDAFRDRQTYATTQSRIYLEAPCTIEKGMATMALCTASEEGIAEVALVTAYGEQTLELPAGEDRVVAQPVRFALPTAQDFAYLRVMTQRGNMAWSSPIWAS